MRDISMAGGHGFWGDVIAVVPDPSGSLADAYSQRFE